MAQIDIVGFIKYTNGTDVYCETLQYIIAKTAKDKMVERDTKFLLDKMNSLIK